MSNPSTPEGAVKFKPPGAMLFLAAMAVFLVVSAAFASPARADVLRVTNLRDDVPGSLRAAIANAAPRGDTIVFAPNVRGTIRLAEGEFGDGTLSIDKNLTIRGPGADKLAISNRNSDGAFRNFGSIFRIDAGRAVRISGLTITGGFAGSGGGIDNEGDLALIRSVVSDNVADFSGGGINNRGNLTLSESVVRDNSTEGFFGGFIYGDGGGIDNFGAMTVNRSTVSGNYSAVSGGGVSSSGGKAVIANSTISGNSVYTFGQGVDGDSGGVGGGIFSNGGLTEIMNTTITDNETPQSGEGGGVAAYDENTTEVSSSIIAGNENTDVVFSGDVNRFVSEGYNLIGSSQAGGAFNEPGDRTGVGNPGLKLLGYNGGLTPTHGLRDGSPATNTGDPDCALRLDQRGVARPQGGRCDIGAFELRPTLDNDPQGCTRVGTGAADILIGTGGGDVLCGLSGNDAMYGLGGNDSLIGGAGNDGLFGGDGGDLVFGQAGGDSLIGGDGADKLRGGNGNDDLLGQGGNDDLRGQAGNDAILGGAGGDVGLGGAGTDFLAGQAGTDRMYGESGNDVVNVRDGAPRDVANGGAGNLDRCAADPGDRRVGCER